MLKFGKLWWTSVTQSSLIYLSCFIPSVEELQDLHDQFHAQVRVFEAQLSQTRLHEAKQSRILDPNRIFRDCAEEAPAKVDALVISKTSDITHVDVENGVLQVHELPAFVDDQPLAINGPPRGLLHSDADHLWVTDCDGVQPGDIIRQDKIFCTDHDILQEFHKVWAPRWQKSSHVLDSQWQQIMDFTTARFQPVHWDMKPWTSTRLCKTILSKKRRAATGPDGVSRCDLAYFAQVFPQPFTDLFDAIEGGRPWPRQLTRGFVASLYKNKGDGGVDRYRPIAVFPLLYRVWSTCRASYSLHSLMPVLPKSIAGGVPGRQAKAVWIEVAQAIEDAYLQDCPVQGMVLDICRAFNAIPRLSVWHFLKVLRFPSDIF